MLPESFILLIVFWIVSVIMLILADIGSFERNWVNMKIKGIGVIFSTGAVVISVLPQRYDIATTANTIVYYNQTVDVTAPGAGGLTTPIDFLKFIVSMMILVLALLDFLITTMEDAA